MDWQLDLNTYLRLVESRKFSCKFCPEKTFKNKEELKEHEDSKHHRCPICFDVLQVEYKYDSCHKWIHRNSKRLATCFECGKKVLHLERHKKYVHRTDHSSVTCKQCNKTFKNAVTFKQHEHASTKEDHVCGPCGKVYKTRKSLTTHTRRYHTKRLLKCDKCGNFVKRANLDKHKTSKSCVRNVCDVCQKLFKSRGALVNHKRIHNLNKRFACRQCQKTFSQKSLLIRHNEVDHNVKPRFSCSKCKLRFTCESRLGWHEMRSEHYGKCDKW